MRAARTGYHGRLLRISSLRSSMLILSLVSSLSRSSHLRILCILICFDLQQLLPTSQSAAFPIQWSALSYSPSRGRICEYRSPFRVPCILDSSPLSGLPSHSTSCRSLPRLPLSWSFASCLLAQAFVRFAHSSLDARLVPRLRSIDSGFGLRPRLMRLASGARLIQRSFATIYTYLAHFLVGSLWSGISLQASCIAALGLQGFACSSLRIYTYPRSFTAIALTGLDSEYYVFFIFNLPRLHATCLRLPQPIVRASSPSSMSSSHPGVFR